MLGFGEEKDVKTMETNPSKSPTQPRASREDGLPSEKENLD